MYIADTHTHGALVVYQGLSALAGLNLAAANSLSVAHRAPETCSRPSCTGTEGLIQCTRTDMHERERATIHPRAREKNLCSQEVPH